MSHAAKPYVSSPSEEYMPYRAISKAAVVSLILGIFSISGLLSPVLVLIGVMGFVFALIALANLRRYPDELTGHGAAIVGMLLSIAMFLGGVGIHTTIYMTEVPDGYERMQFRWLKPEDPAKPMAIPQAALDLNDTDVFVKGYVHPGVAGTGPIRNFILVPDMGTCCFGGQPKLHDMIEVTLTGPNVTQYSRRKLKLAGTFHVNREIRQVVGDLQGGVFSLEADYLK